jgi:hypothetical protein
MKSVSRSPSTCGLTVRSPPTGLDDVEIRRVAQSDKAKNIDVYEDDILMMKGVS